MIKRFRIIVIVSYMALLPHLSFAQKSTKSDTTALLQHLAKHPKNDAAKALLEYKLATAYNELHVASPRIAETICMYTLKGLALSLQLKWAKGILMTDSIGSVSRVGFYFSSKNTDAKTLLQEIISSTEKLDDEELKIKTYIYIAGIYNGLHNTSLSESYQDKVFAYYTAKKNAAAMVSFLTKLDPYNYQVQVDRNKLTVLIKRVLETAISVNDKKSIAGCYSLLGYNYSSLYNTAEAINFYSQAIQVYQQLEDHRAVVAVLDRLGLAYCYGKHNYTTALVYYMKEPDEIKSILGGKLDFTWYKHVAYCYEGLKEYKQTEKYYNMAVAAAATPEDKGEIWRDFSSYYLDRSNYVKAIEAKEKSLANYIKADQKTGVAFTYAEIGDVFALTGNINAALENYQKGFDAYMRLQNAFWPQIILAKMGSLYTKSQPAKAIEYFNKALALLRYLNPESTQAPVLVKMSAAYYNLRNYTKALQYAHLALKDSASFSIDDGDKALAYRTTGNVFRDAPDTVLINNGIKPSDRYKTAIVYLNKSKVLTAWQGETESQRDELEEFSLTYEKLQDYAGAYASYKQYIILRDSINNRQTISAFEQRQASVLFNKKADSLKTRQLLTQSELEKQKLALQLNGQQLSLAKKDKALQQASLQKQNAQLTVNQALLKSAKAETSYQRAQSRYFIGGLIVLLLLSFFIARNYYNQRKANNVITQANKELNEQREEITTQRDNLNEAITGLKAAQNQLVQTEKMASLGELTAGIAHEIQNPLNFVNNFSDVNREMIGELEEALKGGDLEEALAIAGDIRENEEKIFHHGKRADSIVKGMLEHSRATTGQKELTDLNKLADEYLRLAYHGLRAKDKSFNAELFTNFDEALPLVNIIPQDMGRVLLNLFNNAFYAVNERRKVEAGSWKPEVTVTTALENNRVVISVMDNGLGIPDAIKDKIMQPFFTTKPTGEGTGLGLSLSYDIVVKGHGGSIEVKSKEGEGTEFIVNLPIL